jgi:hypothetical protein
MVKQVVQGVILAQRSRPDLRRPLFASAVAMISGLKKFLAHITHDTQVSWQYRQIAETVECFLPARGIKRWA